MSYPKVLATSEPGDLYALLHTENQALLEEISEEGSWWVFPYYLLNIFEICRRPLHDLL
jgi:hypothetical protein